MALKHTKIIILGSGPAGATAAIYCGRAMHETLLFSGPYYGGQLTLTAEIENYPGFVESINGTALMQQLLKHAQQAGATLVAETIVNVDLSRTPFILTNENGDQYSCDALIIATGSKARWLGLPSEEIYRMGGVSACATCDGFLYKNKEVVVVGGGNTAIEEALYLANLASKVTIIHRRTYLTAEAIMQDRLKHYSNIDIVFSCTVQEILGEKNELNRDVVTGIKIKNIDTNNEKIIKASGVFIAIGHVPQSEIFTGQLNLHENNYIKTKPDSTQTNVPGVFAAGDVADSKFKQAITAAGKGCIAALEANNFLRESNKI